MLKKTSTLLCVYWLSLKKIDLEWFIWSTLRSLATMPPGTFLLAVLLSYKDFFFFILPISSFGLLGVFSKSNLSAIFMVYLHIHVLDIVDWSSTFL